MSYKISFTPIAMMYMYYTALTKTNKAETAVLLSTVVHSPPLSCSHSIYISHTHSLPFTLIAMMYYTALMEPNKAETAVLLSAVVHSPPLSYSHSHSLSLSLL